jgi:hypothetical protein
MDSKICMFIKMYILIYRLIAFKHYCVGQIKKMYNIMGIATDDRSRVVSLKFLVGYLSPTYTPEMTEENKGKSRIHLSKLTVAHLDKLSAFYGTRFFIAVFITAHWSPSRSRRIHFTPYHPLAFRTVLLSFFLRLDCFFALGPTFCMHFVMLVTCPVNQVILDRHKFSL